MGLTLFVYPLQISQAALVGDSDLTFAASGIATTDFSAGGDIAWDFAIQPDGRIGDSSQVNRCRHPQLLLVARKSLQQNAAWCSSEDVMFVIARH